MQYKLLASDFDNTLVPFGEPCPRPAVVKAVKKMQAAGGKFVLSTGLLRDQQAAAGRHSVRLRHRQQRSLRGGQGRRDHRRAPDDQ